MNRIQIIILIFSALGIGAKPFDKFPQAEITNKLINACIYLPDADNGYYRSTRFDWSGVIPKLEYKGHTFCGQWFDKYDPTINDAIMGPVESFDPLGYDQAKPDSGFTQIGVGILAKSEDNPYSPFRYYQILDPGKWTIKKKKDEVDFLHKLHGNEYSYEYKKVIKLIKGKPEMTLSHRLKNTGHLTIETEVYNHNLFLIDNQPTGPDFVIKFPFNVMGKETDRKGIGDIAVIKNRQITFVRKLMKGEQAYADLEGYSDSPKDYDIKIENHKTGAGIRITSNRSLSKLVFWSSPTTLCPEPYIHIKVAPGETFNWDIYYHFYTLD